MTITRTQITGKIQLPDGTNAAGGQVEFALSNFDTVAGEDVTILPQSIVADIDISGDIDVLLWTNTEGVRATRYMVIVVIPTDRGGVTLPLGLITVPSTGPVDLNDLLAVEVVTAANDMILTPQQFGSVATMSSDALEAMFSYCIPRNIHMLIAGTHNVDRSVAPNGAYDAHWVRAQLVWAGDDLTELTEARYNPDGSTSPQPSGKRVLFDTKGCGTATNSGLLTLRGSSPGNMKLASRANIPADLVAITASEGGSGDMIWTGLSVIGCGYALWQGDQRGTAPNILPYTRWTVDFFKAQFCLRAVEGGQSGNCFDDGVWSNVRLTRNADNGTVRTDFVSNSIFLNGLRFASDAETFTASTTAGSPHVETNVAHGLVAGAVVSIDGANQNLSGATALPLTSRVAAVPSATELTLEAPADRTISGAAVIVNPPSFRLASCDLIAQHIYVEEVQDMPINVLEQGRISTPDFKVSDGVIGCRGNVPVAVTGFKGTSVNLGLNQRSGQFNSRVKYVVGVAPSLKDGAYSSTSVEVRTRNAEADFVGAQVVGGIKLEADQLAGSTSIEGLPHGENNYVAVRYAGGWRGYQVSMWGNAHPTLKSDLKSIYTLGSNLTDTITVDGMTRTGTFGAPSGGEASKTAPGPGTLYEAITVSPGDLLIADVTASVIGTGGFLICLFDSAGTDTAAGDIVFRGPAVRLADTVRAYLTVPPGGADRVGVFGFSSATGTFTDFVLRKVETL